MLKKQLMTMAKGALEWLECIWKGGILQNRGKKPQCKREKNKIKLWLCEVVLRQEREKKRKKKKKIIIINSGIFKRLYTLWRTALAKQQVNFSGQSSEAFTFFQQWHWQVSAHLSSPLISVRWLLPQLFGRGKTSRFPTWDALFTTFCMGFQVLHFTKDCDKRMDCKDD